MIKASLINRLLRWGKWKLKGADALGYPSKVNYIRLAPETTHFRDPGIDIECDITQRAYDKLPLIFKVAIWVEYLSTAKKQKEKALSFGRSTREYRRTLKEAHVMIGNLIDQSYEIHEKNVA